MDDEKYYHKYLKYKARYQNEMLKKEMSGGYYDMLFNNNIGDLGGVNYNFAASVNNENLYGQNNYFSNMMNNLQDNYINSGDNKVQNTDQQNKYNSNKELSIPQKIKFILDSGNDNLREYFVNRNDPNFQSKNFIKQLYYSNINKINGSVGGGINNNIIISKSTDIKDEIDDSFLKEVIKTKPSVRLYFITGGGNNIAIQTDLISVENTYGLSNQLIQGFSESMTLGESLKEMGKLHQLIDTPFVVDPESKNVLSVKENNNRVLGDFKNSDNVVEMYFNKYKTLPVTNLPTNKQPIRNRQPTVIPTHHQSFGQQQTFNRQPTLNLPYNVNQQQTSNQQSVSNTTVHGKGKFEGPYPFTETEQSINNESVPLKQKPSSNTSFDGPYSFTDLTEQSINNESVPLKQKPSSNISFDGPYSFTDLTEQSVTNNIVPSSQQQTQNKQFNTAFDGPYSFTDLTEQSLTSDTPNKHSTLDTILTNKSLFEGPFSLTEQSVSNNVSSFNSQSSLNDQLSFTEQSLISNSSIGGQSSFDELMSLSDQSFFTE